MRGYIVFQISSGEHWAVKKNLKRLEEAAIEMVNKLQIRYSQRLVLTSW
jgi:hypothetical protein